MTTTLTISSCQAPNSEFIGRDLAAYIRQNLDVDVTFIGDIPWQTRKRRLLAGEIDLCWVCGLVYAREVDRGGPLKLLAAPAGADPRYEERPIYFSDVMVRRDSRFRSFADLRGASWAYNESGSHSGYNVTRYHLATLAEKEGYFGRVVAAGSHQEALWLVAAEEVDGAAIDSTVLELERVQDAAIDERLRAVAAIGPSPAPPWVIGAWVPETLRSALRALLLGMEQDAEGQRLLARARLARYTAVADADYDPIRAMDRLAQGVKLGANE